MNQQRTKNGTGALITLHRSFYDGNRDKYGNLKNAVTLRDIMRRLGEKETTI